jgi:hypothetical protein
MVLLGQLPLDEEQKLIAATRQWLEERVGERDVFGAYLERWGDWTNPWAAAPA